LKAIIVVGDGMADLPVDELDNKTPLQVSDHPNMDWIAKNSLCGISRNVPVGMDPESSVANLSILGYDPLKYYTGRAPLEAGALGIKLSPEDLVFRCNLVTVENEILVDYSAGHISDEEARSLIVSLNAHLGIKGEIEFYSGVGYRNLLVLHGEQFSDDVRCFPPHDFQGNRISDLMVKPLSKEAVFTANLLIDLILKSKKILENHPVNLRRIKLGKKPANMIWVWGCGRRPNLPSFTSLFGIKGAVITAVSLIKGIGFYAGLKVIEVPGATGYYDTNYEGKADYALKGLEEGYDLVYIHVEAPDEASHEGNVEMKIKSIEDLDKRLIGRILDKIHSISEDFILLVLPDHPTSLKLRKHLPDPVPFALYNSCKRVKGSDRFDEVTMGNSAKLLVKGNQLMRFLINAWRSK